MLSPLDKWLLTQDWTAPVSASALSTLSVANLAVAAIRVDLPVPLRLTAQEAFKARTEMSQRSRWISEGEPLLAFDLDFPLPASLDSYTPTQLLLLPHNPRCTSFSLVDEAGALFFRLCEQAKCARRNVRLQLAGYRLSWDGSEREETSEVLLEVADDEVRLLWAGKGGEEKLDYRIAAKDIEAVSYLAENGENGAGRKTAWTVVLRLAKATTSVRQHEVRSLSAELELGFRDGDDEQVKAVTEAVERWKEQVGFEVRMERRAQPHSEAVPSSGTASSWTKRQSSTLQHRSSTDLLSLKHRATDDRPPSAKFRQSSTSSLPLRPRPGSPRRPQLVKRTFSAWKYVGSLDAPVEWTAGFYGRQFRFIESVDPHLSFPSVEFTDEEVVLLSFMPNRDNLPRVPTHLLPAAASYRFSAGERLAVEHIYHSIGDLSVDDTRCILYDTSAPALHSYLRVLHKIIDARDALADAYGLLLQKCLYPRLRDVDPAEPVERLIPIVEELRNKQSSRRSWFSTGFAKLSTKSRFPVKQLGELPTRRFEEKMAGIVEYEKDLMRAFEKAEEERRAEE
ncbi:hypothetical protein JCM10213_000160 [Rhodosporidiobolus nylandii]